MALAKFLSEESICTSLRAQARDEAVRELLCTLVDAGRLSNDDLEPAFRAVIRREALGSTAIGRGVAVPHARAGGLGRTLVALGLSAQGVDFNALDGERVRSIFLVIGTEDPSDEYLSVMGTISELIQNDDFRRFLLRAHTSSAILELIEEMGG